MQRTVRSRNPLLEGDFPENLHGVVCVIINKCSFESFMCFDLTDLLFQDGFVMIDLDEDGLPVLGKCTCVTSS